MSVVRSMYYSSRDQGSVLSTYVRQITTAFSGSYEESDAPCLASCITALMHGHRETTCARNETGGPLQEHCVLLTPEPSCQPSLNKTNLLKRNGKKGGTKTEGGLFGRRKGGRQHREGRRDGKGDKQKQNTKEKCHDGFHYLRI